MASNFSFDGNSPSESIRNEFNRFISCSEQAHEQTQTRKKKLVFNVDILAEEIHIELAQIDLMIRCAEIVVISVSKETFLNKLAIVFTKYILDFSISLEK